jgi:hypothetical protein
MSVDNNRKCLSVAIQKGKKQKLMWDDVHNIIDTAMQALINKSDAIAQLGKMDSNYPVRDETAKLLAPIKELKSIVVVTPPRGTEVTYADISIYHSAYTNVHEIANKVAIDTLDELSKGNKDE